MIKKTKTGSSLIETDADIKEQKNRTWKALKVWVKSRKEEDREKLKVERGKLREIRRRKKEEEREEKWKRVEDSRGMTEFWNAIRSFRPRKNRKGANIKKHEWNEHFKKLLGASDPNSPNMEGEGESEEESGEDNGNLNAEITFAEVKEALQKMRNNKAAGEDGIVVEFLKELPMTWVKELVIILNGIFNTGKLIEGWEVARIYPIHKAGNENEVKNYRGVSLLDVGYKLLTNIMANRIREWLEETGGLKESQAGFREERVLLTIRLRQREGRYTWAL